MSSYHSPCKKKKIMIIISLYNQLPIAHKALSDLPRALNSIPCSLSTPSQCSRGTGSYFLTMAEKYCFRAFGLLLCNTPDLVLLINQILTEASFPLRGLPWEQKQPPLPSCARSSRHPVLPSS